MKKLKEKKAVKKEKSKPSVKVAEGNVYVKEHSREYLGYKPRVVIAMCDASLMGAIHADTKTGAVLNLKDHGTFYAGRKVNAQEASSILAKYANYERASFNLVGYTTIKIASQYFNTARAKKIGKALHLEIYRL